MGEVARGGIVDAETVRRVMERPYPDALPRAAAETARRRRIRIAEERLWRAIEALATDTRDA